MDGDSTLRSRDILIQSQNSGVFVKGDQVSGGRVVKEDKHRFTLSELITTASNSITDHDGDDHIILSKNGAECESAEAKIATRSEDDIFEDEEEEQSESDGAEYIDTDNETDIQSDEDDS
uniref:Uncharacterized protein n=1 Tax=Oryza brachyantha TaxID=4533 RepID=J3MD96_ORYBR